MKKSPLCPTLLAMSEDPFFQLVNIPLGLPSNHFRNASLSFMISLNNYVCTRKQIKKNNWAFQVWRPEKVIHFIQKYEGVGQDSPVISQTLYIMSLAVWAILWRKADHGIRTKTLTMHKGKKKRGWGLAGHSQNTLLCLIRNHWQGLMQLLTYPCACCRVSGLCRKEW